MCRSERDHCVVQYLYVHGPDEQFSYPSTRAEPGAAGLAIRYLECALVQAASLRFKEAACDLAFVTNLSDVRDIDAIGERGAKLMDAMEALGVSFFHAPYEHRTAIELQEYGSSRYVFDAMAAMSSARPDQIHWYVDVDCVWMAPHAVFAAAPATGEIACIEIPYPRHWDVLGGGTPQNVGELGLRIGPCEVPVPWVGGELLAGDRETIEHLVAATDALDREVAAMGETLPAEEHLLSLAAGLGRVRFRDLSAVAYRLLTGPRHHAVRRADPSTLGFWHLPTEKGLAFRRAASAILSGRTRELRRDLADMHRAARRFNVSRAGLGRRIRDDAWLAAHRARSAVLARTAGLRRR